MINERGIWVECALPRCRERSYIHELDTIIMTRLSNMRRKKSTLVGCSVILWGIRTGRALNQSHIDRLDSATLRLIHRSLRILARNGRLDQSSGNFHIVDVSRNSVFCMSLFETAATS